MKSLRVICFLTIASLYNVCHAETQCTPPTSADIVRVGRSLNAWMPFRDLETVTLVGSELVGDTCYRKLQLKLSNGNLMHAYLSPDHRFVMTSLIDLNNDAAHESLESSQMMQKSLLAVPSPSRGPDSSPVTIVEFGDFQCPYCKRFDGWIAQLPADLKTKVRLVYKFRPLPGHDWATAAAEVADCAFAKSPTDFWLVHDYFLEHQGDVTLATAQPQALRILNAQSPDDETAVKKCLADGKGQADTRENVERADQMGIRSTPTVFLNGALLHLHYYEELESAIRKSVNDSSPRVNDAAPNVTTTSAAMQLTTK